MKRRNRSGLYAFLSSPFTLVIASILFVVLARAAWSIHEKARESSLRLEIAQADFAKLQQSQADLAQRVEQLSTPEGVKAQIRERYHAVEPGESVAVIVDGPAQQASATPVTAGANAAAAGDSGGWWAGFLRMIGLRD
jgi:cell division protein FtsB